MQVQMTSELAGGNRVKDGEVLTCLFHFMLPLKLGEAGEQRQRAFCEHTQSPECEMLLPQPCKADRAGVVLTTLEMRIRGPQWSWSPFLTPSGWLSLLLALRAAQR